MSDNGPMVLLPPFALVSRDWTLREAFPYLCFAQSPIFLFKVAISHFRILLFIWFSIPILISPWLEVSTHPRIQYWRFVCPYEFESVVRAEWVSWGQQFYHSSGSSSSSTTAAAWDLFSGLSGILNFVFSFRWKKCDRFQGSWTRYLSSRTSVVI